MCEFWALTMQLFTYCTSKVFLKQQLEFYILVIVLRNWVSERDDESKEIGL